MFKRITIQKSHFSDANYFVVEGLASTSDIDSYGEIINQHGIDLSLVSEGSVQVNIEHGEDFPLYELSVVGNIIDARIEDEGLWVRAHIYWAHPHAKRIYDEIVKSPESVQFSVELADCEYGDGKFSDVILHAKLIGVAFTKNPANDSTYSEIVKSMGDPEYKELARELISLKIRINSLERWIRRTKILTARLKK